MNHSTLKLRKVIASDIIENWDDDDLDIDGDDLTFRSASVATSVTTALSQRRDSISSRISTRSDIESNYGDEEKHVNVLGDDELSTNDAIATANLAGIPIPKNIPASALVGGTIKRLGTRKIAKTLQDDWDDGDLEFLGDTELKVKRHDESLFPETLRQVSGSIPLQISPVRQQKSVMSSCYDSRRKPRLNQSSDSLLDRYRDDQDKDFTKDRTIIVSKNWNVPKLRPILTSPTLYRKHQTAESEEFEEDLQFPASDNPLRLTVRRDLPKTPSSAQDESDEWGEGGSLGTRHGGKWDRTSYRGSSVTTLSPSLSSSLTVESEDEGIEGLLLPNGPIHFKQILMRKQQKKTFIENIKESSPTSGSKDDFLSGLDIGNEDVFDSKKLTINRNVKLKTTRLTSPTRPKAAVSLTFTTKPLTSRLPRPLAGYDCTPSSLEPVSESGGPVVNRNRRLHPRLGGHSAQLSITSVATPATPSCVSIPPSTPRKRELLSKNSLSILHQEPTTTSAQLLKMKRSMPIIRSFQSNNKPSSNIRSDRPTSYIEGSRPPCFSRPKTPVERGRGTEFSQHHSRIHPAPFLPAGTSNSQSHHILTKNSRNFRRHNSESSNNSLERHSSSRTVSRSNIRSSSPRRKGADALVREATTKRLLTKPIRSKNFGDGCELDAFDDLPISRESEQKFLREPTFRGPPRNHNCRKFNDRDTRTTSIHTSTSLTSMKSRDKLPRFARDTMASRLARENTLTQRVPSIQAAPLTAITNHWKAKVSASTGLGASKTRSTKLKKSKGVPLKPQLIKPLGNCNNPKSVKGMYYNPNTYQWEGNDCDLSPFDTSSSPSAISNPSLACKETRHNYREKEILTPRPALIQHVKSTHNVQVVGGMVFDPQRMCWLKISSKCQKDNNSSDKIANSLDSFNDDEDDVFRDVPDLEEGSYCDFLSSGLKNDNYRDNFLVGEEFDVGPEFIKRQREEEKRWKRKVDLWIQTEIGIDRGNPNWRWIIRDMIMNH